MGQRLTKASFFILLKRLSDLEYFSKLWGVNNSKNPIVIKKLLNQGLKDIF